MTSNRFSIKQKNLRSSTVLLQGKEHFHLSKVARIKPQERVWLFDEKGINYLARVEEVKEDRTRLFILEKMDKVEPKVKITVAQALIKSKNMDIIIQKSTELGVTTFIPVISTRTIIKIEGKIQKKLEKWQKIAHEAAKQSQHSSVPAILSPKPLKKLIEERREVKKLILSENQGKHLKDILIEGLGSKYQKENPPSSVLVLIGPEGGWTEEEEASIISHGFEAVSLGERVLRAETAAICCLALIYHFWNS
ncbi:MAG: 16S rRNA (uracil(1498)-N(3))-methyltransferase [Candidatus Aminicenantes bacterium]|nr:16S rRNA (uracil(1498)-N(3))-methyltransferase [Candidatus Aminicenantes bacterium]MBL7082843.1 16S rRNA (uracil(1498)-N(3))-methyltransferase [Candidatus Aminicenantes bacterium]